MHVHPERNNKNLIKRILIYQTAFLPKAPFIATKNFLPI
jgi:hypothetical protein